MATEQKEGYSHNPALNGQQSDNVAVTGGSLMTGQYPKTEFRKFANPAPLGLSAFALTTFILGLTLVNSRGVGVPNIVLGCAYAYGGLVQLLAGMWEMAVGNTFGATALSSYGGFWISYAILITGGAQSYGAVDAYEPTTAVGGEHLNSALGFFLIGWWIFTTILLIATLRTTVAFFSLFFTLDMAFLLLAIAKFTGKMHVQTAGGVFALMAAFLAWYCALAGILDEHNSFFMVPVIHLPWSPTARARKMNKSHAV